MRGDQNTARRTGTSQPARQKAIKRHQRVPNEHRPAGREKANARKRTQTVQIRSGNKQTRVPQKRQTNRKHQTRVDQQHTQPRRGNQRLQTKLSNSKRRVGAH